MKIHGSCYYFRIDIIPGLNKTVIEPNLNIMSGSETPTVLLAGWAWDSTLPRGPPPRDVHQQLNLGLGFSCGMSDLCDTGCSFPVVSLLSELERLGPFGK